MQALTGTAARYIFAIPFIIFGLMHFMAGGEMAGMVPSFIPGGVFWVYLTGLALVLAGISLVIKKKDKLAALLLGIMLILFVLTIHLPSVMGGNQMAMSQVLKDLALAGAAFAFSGMGTD
ncbi:MAG: DoxX family protein [Calditrichaeota bacterium]|nr:MAG: DoxX family protein [Calditrichota bacterium]MBL1206791.1 DoxX family protein [Calditrichota bacterium]NOG46619.1 DoxX family protein [Calditrichota bacterium]